MSTRGLQRMLTLPPSAESARAARRFVDEIIASAGAAEFSDTATLLTSELVTNGIVHAHTDLHLTVEATPRWVRVTVTDADPRLPARRGYDAAATTGRGLEMVELLAADFGVESHEEGKSVWFRLGATPGSPDPAALDPAPAAAGESLPLRLLHVPIGLYCAAQQHAEALLREATLAAIERDPDGVGDYQLATRALGGLADAANELFERRDGEVAFDDVTLRLPAELLPWFPILRELLAHASAASRAGRLLVPPSLPEVDAVRDWVWDEIARQSAGLAPTAWTVLGAGDSQPLRLDAARLVAVRSATSAQIAADVSNRIVAVSGAVEELLGWPPDELEGRRLVTIIPPGLRDRHVAGFTRHLVDGSERILGHDVVVPALRRDGSQVTVVLRIESRPGPGMQRMFVATLTEHVGS